MKKEVTTKKKTANNGNMLSGWHVCPKCLGQGTVSKPPYLAGDINHWSDSVGQHQCNLCNGKMIISIATGLPPANHF